MVEHATTVAVPFPDLRIKIFCGNQFEAFIPRGETFPDNSGISDGGLVLKPCHWVTT
jgi:hypothetical protein